MIDLAIKILTTIMWSCMTIMINGFIYYGIWHML